MNITVPFDANDNPAKQMLCDAINNMLDNGEFEKDYTHKKRVRRIKKQIVKLREEFGSLGKAPLILIINAIDDADVWRSVICSEVAICAVMEVIENLGLFKDEDKDA